LLRFARNDILLFMIEAILLMAAQAAEGEFPTFKDWTAGCDNGRSCMGVGQYNPANFDLASVVLERGPLAGDVPKIWFRSEGGPVVDLQADGKRLGVKLSADADDYAITVDPASVPLVVEAMKSAKSLIPVRGDGKPSFPLSVSGASAAMRWIDEQQKRAGTVTALVATGPAPASAVPHPPPLPVVAQAVPSGALGKPLTNAEVARIQEEHAECTDEDLDGKVQYGRLDSRTTLAIVTVVCGSGAYNFYGIPMLLRDDGTRAVADVGKHDEGDVTMNLSWDDKARLLTSYFKGRGIGDCGASTDWAWDGARFRVVQEKAMGECQGAIAWIPYYRARVVPAQSSPRP
jgi:hypothetical protein